MQKHFASATVLLFGEGLRKQFTEVKERVRLGQKPQRKWSQAMKLHVSNWYLKTEGRK